MSTEFPSESQSFSGKRLSQTQARELVAAWEASGLSVKAFAEKHGVRPDLIYRWRHRLREGGSTATAPADGRLAQVQVVDCGVGVTVHFPDGLRVEASGAWSPDQVAVLCGALRC